MTPSEIAQGMTEAGRAYLLGARRTLDGRWLTPARGIVGERMRKAGLSRLYSVSTDEIVELGLQVRTYLQSMEWEDLTHRDVVDGREGGR
jgi:hypothetical protein